MKKQINEIGRTCSKCNEFKNWSEYHKEKSQKTGYKPACKRCLGNKGFRSDNIEEFLEKRIDKSGETGCWNWIGSKNKDGYGTIDNPWKKQFGTKFAHRISYIVHQYPIEEGMLICHHCDNPSCVNPDHLYQGTHQDNVDDKMARGRHKSGSKQLRILTPEQVREIRNLPKSIPLRDIAKIYKTSKSTVCRIINKKSYTDVI